MWDPSYEIKYGHPLDDMIYWMYEYPSYYFFDEHSYLCGLVHKNFKSLKRI